MKIEITHRFTATHCHPIPPDGALSKVHPHDWVLTMRFEGPRDPTYGWVLDFDEGRRVLARAAAGVLPGGHFGGTAEALLIALVHEVAFLLPRGEPAITWARLEEKPGQAAIYESRDEHFDFGPVVR